MSRGRALSRYEIVISEFVMAHNFTRKEFKNIFESTTGITIFCSTYQHRSMIKPLNNERKRT